VHTLTAAYSGPRTGGTHDKQSTYPVPPAERASVLSLQRRLGTVTDKQASAFRVTDLEQRLAAAYGEWRTRGFPPPADASRSSVGADCRRGDGPGCPARDPRPSHNRAAWA
jgi:hypothetical protein